MGTNATIRVGFLGGDLSGASVSTSNVRVLDAAGAPLAINPVLQAGELEIPAPGGGWPAGDLTVQLFAGLQSTTGTGLAAPVSLPMRVQ